MKTEKTELIYIGTPAGCQARLTLDTKTVEEYREAYQGAASMPPVSVVKITEKRKAATNFPARYVLWDGFHRYEAMRKEYDAFCVQIEVEVTDERETFDDAARCARLLAAGANAEHGLKRTNEDKRNAVEMLLDDPEWCEWSDRQIAKAAKVSHTYVANIRKERQKFYDAYGNEISVGGYVKYAATGPAKESGMFGRIDGLDAFGNIELTVWDPSLGSIEEYGRLVATIVDNVCQAEKPKNIENGNVASEKDQNSLPVLDSPVHYDDGKDSYVFAGAGLGDDAFMSLRLPKYDAGSRHRVKSPNLPVRDTLEEAEEDLLKYAHEKGWDLWEPNSEMFAAVARINKRLGSGLAKDPEQSIEPIAERESATPPWRVWVMETSERLEKMTGSKHPEPFYRLAELFAGLVKDRSIEAEINREAYEMGARDFKTGKKSTEDCPYRNVLRAHWFDGWYDAEKEAVAGDDSSGGESKPGIPDAMWRNAVKLGAAFELNMLYFDDDEKRIWQLDPESTTVELIYTGKTKAAAKRELESLLEVDGYNMRRLCDIGDMYRARKRTPVGEGHSWAIYCSQGAGQYSGGWKIMQHPETGEPMKYETEEEMEAAWIEHVQNNDTVLED